MNLKYHLEFKRKIHSFVNIAILLDRASGTESSRLSNTKLYLVTARLESKEDHFIFQTKMPGLFALKGRIFTACKCPFY